MVFICYICWVPVPDKAPSAWLSWHVCFHSRRYESAAKTNTAVGLVTMCPFADLIHSACVFHCQCEVPHTGIHPPNTPISPALFCWLLGTEEREAQMLRSSMSSSLLFLPPLQTSTSSNPLCTPPPQQSCNENRGETWIRIRWGRHRIYLNAPCSQVLGLHRNLNVKVFPHIHPNFLSRLPFSFLLPPPSASASKQSKPDLNLQSLWLWSKYFMALKQQQWPVGGQKKDRRIPSLSESTVPFPNLWEWDLLSKDDLRLPTNYQSLADSHI